jgi:hypothetical protein
MTDYSADRGPRPADLHARLRLAALIAVIAGVILLAAAAFVLSYEGIHHLALRAGVSSQLARLYPVIFDAMLVIAGAAALALRGAGLWARCYAWFSLLLMLAVLAVGNAVYATNVTLPAQPTRAVVAVTPWVLLLLAFGLLLEMLRYFRRGRPANGQRREPGQAVAPSDAGAAAAASENGSGDSGAGRAAVTWAAAGGGAEGRPLPQPRTGLDTLLGPREGQPPAMPVTVPGDGAAMAYSGQAEHHAVGHYPDPVAYSEETGYVHPESYQAHAPYPGANGPAGHEGYAGPEDQDYPGHSDEPGQTDPAAAVSTAGTVDDTASSGDDTAAAGDGTASSADDTAGSGDASPGGGKEAGDLAKEDRAKDPQPAAASSAEATAQAAPAETQKPPAPDGDTAALPPRSVMPLFERLRSTPAPPGD